MSDLAGTTVLVVEDEFLVAIEYQILLDRFGCEVLGPVPSIAEAFVLLRHNRPDMALLDVRLGNGRVTPIAEALKAAGVPFVLVTGCEPEEMTDPVLSQVPWLGKPYEPEKLRSMMECVLASHCGDARRGQPPSRLMPEQGSSSL